MASIIQIQVPRTPKRIATPRFGLQTPPATVRHNRILSPAETKFPPIVYPADEPNAPYFSPRTEYFRLATTPTPEVKPTQGDLQKEALANDDYGEAVESDGDDEIEFLGSTVSGVLASPVAFNTSQQTQGLVVRDPNAAHPATDQHARSLFLGGDEAVDLQHPSGMGDAEDDGMEGDWEYVGRSSGTPLREVDEDGSCKACGCRCQIEKQEQGGEGPPERRGRRNGSGSTTLSSRVMGNILGTFCCSN